MSKTWLYGGIGLAVILALGAVGATHRTMQMEADVQSMPHYVGGFLKDCRSAIRGKNAKAICACMAESFEGALRTEDEYKLAGAIVAAITESGLNKSRMQSKFNQLSQRFDGRISIDRKASVLRVVSTEGVSCGTAHGA